MLAVAWDAADGASIDEPASMAGEALYLAVTLARLLEDDAEAWSLAALIALSLSRAGARTGPFVPLEEQDPWSWDRALMAQGEAHLRRAASHTSGAPGRFQLEAAMQAVHAARLRTGLTDWAALETLSTALVIVAPTIGARVARAVIVGRTEGAESGLAYLTRIDAPPDYPPYLAAHADLLARAGDPQAVAAFGAAAAASTGRVAEYLALRARGLQSGTNSLDDLA